MKRYTIRRLQPLGTARNGHTVYLWGVFDRRAPDIPVAMVPTKPLADAARRSFNDLRVECEYAVDGDVITILLWDGIHTTLVDAQDIALTQFIWHLSGGYAARGGGADRVYLHRSLLNAGPSQMVDHINGNRLDNRRANLRLCTNGENLYNRPRQANNTTGYKGVRQHGRRYQALIRVNKKTYCLGSYATPEQAARAYNAAALRYHGEFAYLNTIEEQTDEQ